MNNLMKETYLESPTKAYNRAHSGRASRRQLNHRVANKPWFGPIKYTQAPIEACASCFMIRTACECES